MKKYYIVFDEYERGIIINALNDKRNALIREGRYTDAVDEVLLTSGRLNGFLADIDKQAEDMLFRLVKQMVEREGITEQLKADNQMEWVARMNNIRQRATEIVNADQINNKI